MTKYRRSRDGNGNTGNSSDVTKVSDTEFLKPDAVDREIPTPQTRRAKQRSLIASTICSRETQRDPANPVETMLKYIATAVPPSFGTPGYFQLRTTSVAYFEAVAMIEKTLKVVLVGDSMCGKVCLLAFWSFLSS